MGKRKPCPIPGCAKKWMSGDGLMAHLYNGHLKADLVKWIVDQVTKP